jgi:chromosome segregation ATPase
MQSLSLQNSSLRSKIQQLTSLSKDQSDILLDLLPKVDLLEDELQATQVEKEQLNKQIHSLEAENVELITDWNDVEIKLELLKNENCILKRQVKDYKQKLGSYIDKDVAAEQRFQKQKKKRKRVEMEKAETEQVLEMHKFEVHMVKKEKVVLELDLEDTMGELERLKKRVKKMKKRYIANGSLRSGKENRNDREIKVHRGVMLFKEKVKNSRIRYHEEI